MQQCQAAVDQLALFSSNEDADDIATAGQEQSLYLCMLAKVHPNFSADRHCSVHLQISSTCLYLLCMVTYWHRHKSGTQRCADTHCSLL